MAVTMKKAKADYAKAKKKPLGEGSRFKAVEEMAKAGGASNPAAVAASIGIKKYGKKKMGQLAKAGKKKNMKKVK